MNRYRWRRILEINYREGRKQGYYFNRKSYKKIYQIWVRAKRLGLTKTPYDSFAREIISRSSRGIVIEEMIMNIGKIEKHLSEVESGASE